MPATGGSSTEENADMSTQRASDSAVRKIFVHPDKFYGYPNDDCLDWFASFERIAHANEWDDAKCGCMVSARGGSSSLAEWVTRENFLRPRPPKHWTRPLKTK